MSGSPATACWLAATSARTSSSTPELARKLVARAGVRPGETVLEIGAGLGVLTEQLAEVAERVVAVEIDAGLVRALGEEGLPGNVELVHADALAIDLAGRLPGTGPARVVANLPYAIASPLLRRLLDLRERLEGWSVMVQREVGRRLAARPGSRDYGSLAVLHALTARVDAGLDVHPRCFYPVPAVTSTFLGLQPLPEPLLSPGELGWVERVVRAAFRHRRKTLVNSLRTALAAPAAPPPGQVAGWLESRGRSASARAEELHPEELLELARRLADAGRVEGSRHG